MIGTEKRLRPCLKSVLIDEGLLRQTNFNKHNGHVIEYLLTELGRVERGNIWLSVRTHGPHVKYFPVRRSHSVNKYILFTLVHTGGIDRM